MIGKHLLKKYGRVVLLFAILFLLAGCQESSTRLRVGQWAQVDNLYVRVKESKTAPVVTIFDQGSYRIFEPQKEDSQFALFWVDLSNYSTGLIILQVVSDKVNVKDSDGNEYYPVQLSEGKSLSDTEQGNRYLSQPIFRESVTLQRGYEVSGWLPFEVPKGTKLAEFEWEEIGHASFKL